jgi:hypothetical protein
MLDDNRPVLTLSTPAPGTVDQFDRIVIGMDDYNTGLDLATLQVTANFDLDTHPPGDNLAAEFTQAAPGVWEYRFARPVMSLADGVLDISISDREGNESRVRRLFRVVPP